MTAMPAEFITRDGAMQYRMIPLPPPPIYKIALPVRVHAGSFSGGDFNPSDRPLDIESREYELIDIRDGLLLYREV